MTTTFPSPPASALGAAAGERSPRPTRRLRGGDRRRRRAAAAGQPVARLGERALPHPGGRAGRRPRQRVDRHGARRQRRVPRDRPAWLRALGEVATTAVGLAALVAIWQVWPLDLTLGWDVLARLTVGIGIAGSVIGIVAAMVRFVRELSPTAGDGLGVGPEASAPCRWCRPRRRTCPRDSAARVRTAAPARRGSAGALHPSKAISTTCSGRSSTTHPSVPSTASSVNRSVCQRSISSVMPLNVLPIMTNPPVSGSRAPRWMLESSPRRRPEPHSTARTTRSSVWVGLTLTHPLPRRPAAYGLSAALTTTPSWPAATSSSKKRPASRGVGGDDPRDDEVRARGRRAPRAARARSRRAGRSRRRWSTSKRNGVSGTDSRSRRRRPSWRCGRR